MNENCILKEKKISTGVYASGTNTNLQAACVIIDWSEHFRNLPYIQQYNTIKIASINPNQISMKKKDA